MFLIASAILTMTAHGYGFRIVRPGLRESLHLFCP
jgi:hypothetical protein